MLLKIETYTAVGAVHWMLSVRDLEAGPDEPGLIQLVRGATPLTDLDEVDQVVLAAQQAIDTLLRSHMVRQDEE